MSEFVINPNKRNGYPTIDDNQYDFGPTQISPYPKYVEYIGPSSILHGYPIFYNWKNFSPVQSSPYPAAMFAIDSTKMRGYPSFASFGNFSPVQSAPYPVSMFNIDNTKMRGYPSYSTFGDFSPVETPPHPRDMMRCKVDFFGGYPTYEVKQFKQFGAFEDAVELDHIQIPVTVKNIADYAFYNTAITKVTISRDCVYREIILSLKDVK